MGIVAPTSMSKGLRWSGSQPHSSLAFTVSFLAPSEGLTSGGGGPPSSRVTAAVGVHAEGSPQQMPGSPKTMRCLTLPAVVPRSRSHRPLHVTIRFPPPQFPPSVLAVVPAATDSAPPGLAAQSDCAAGLPAGCLPGAARAGGPAGAGAPSRRILRSRRVRLWRAVRPRGRSCTPQKGRLSSRSAVSRGSVSLKKRALGSMTLSWLRGSRVWVLSPVRPPGSSSRMQLLRLRLRSAAGSLSAPLPPSSVHPAW